MIALILTIYLAYELNFSTKQISLFFALLPVIIVVITQFSGKISDMGYSRRRIILYASAFGFMSNVIFYQNPTPQMVFFLLIPVYSLSQVAYPQIFASALEFSLK